MSLAITKTETIEYCNLNDTTSSISLDDYEMPSKKQKMAEDELLDGESDDETKTSKSSLKQQLKETNENGCDEDDEHVSKKRRLNIQSNDDIISNTNRLKYSTQSLLSPQPEWYLAAQHRQAMLAASLQYLKPIEREKILSQFYSSSTNATTSDTQQTSSLFYPHAQLNPQAAFLAQYHPQLHSYSHSPHSSFINQFYQQQQQQQQQHPPPLHQQQEHRSSPVNNNTSLERPDNSRTPSENQNYDDDDQSLNGTNGEWTYEEQFKQLYELSDDPKRKEFLDDLFAFMQKRGSPVNRIPIMAKHVLDLYELYRLVVSKGGLVEVINKKLWREITKGLNLPSSITSAAFTLRTQYMKYLYPYECEKHKLSSPGELQSAIDGNRREGRKPAYGYEYPSPSNNQTSDVPLVPPHVIHPHSTPHNPHHAFLAAAAAAAINAQQQPHPPPPPGHPHFFHHHSHPENIHHFPHLKPNFFDLTPPTSSSSCSSTTSSRDISSHENNTEPPQTTINGRNVLGSLSNQKRNIDTKNEEQTKKTTVELTPKFSENETQKVAETCKLTKIKISTKDSSVNESIISQDKSISISIEINGILYEGKLSPSSVAIEN